MKKICRLMIRTCWLSVVAWLVMGTLTMCRKKEATSTTLEPLKQAGEFYLQSFTGDSLRLADHRNSVVVLWFFGYGCCYCRASAPEIQKTLVVPYAARADYMIIGLDIWNGTATEVESFSHSTGLTIPLLLNASGVAAKYETSVDRLVVIDKKGYIRFEGTRFANLELDTVRGILSHLLTK